MQFIHLWRLVTNNGIAEVDDAIIIFDEAHNIEDVSREASSIELERQAMIDVYLAFERAFILNGKPQVYGPLMNVGKAVLTWMALVEKKVRIN